MYATLSVSNSSVDLHLYVGFYEALNFPCKYIYDLPRIMYEVYKPRLTVFVPSNWSICKTPILLDLCSDHFFIFWSSVIYISFL